MLTASLQTKKKKKSKKASKGLSSSKKGHTSGTSTATGADTKPEAANTTVTKRHQAPQVEEADDD